MNAINIEPDDALIDVQITDGSDDVVLATRDGMAIRFHESDVRGMGRVATGVRGIRLRSEDHVIGMVVIRPEFGDATTVLTVTEYGRGKRTLIEDYPQQSRGGQGVINFRLNEQTGRVVAIKSVQETDELMVITRNGIVNRQHIGDMRVIGRATQGVRVVMLDEGDAVMDIARVVPEEGENGAGPLDDGEDGGSGPDARALADETTGSPAGFGSGADDAPGDDFDTGGPEDSPEEEEL